MKIPKQCVTPPLNQPLEWYRNALNHFGRGNLGEGKDYDIEELKTAYYQKLAKHEEKLFNKMVKNYNERPEHD